MIHKSFFYLFGLIAAGMLLVACGGAEPTPTPTATPQSAQPTFTPTTAPQEPSASLPTPTLATQQNAPAPAAFALPAAFYYIDRTSGQIMRMERDASTVTQITNEGASITAFDVAPVSGDLVYVANNSLVQSDARGGNRVVKLQGPSLIDDGSPNPFPGVVIRNPIFSPDGQYIVFGLGDLYLMATGPTTAYQALIPAKVEVWGTQEFWPDSWSPDGQRLLVYGSALGPPVSFIYTLATGTTLPINSPISEGRVWGADGRMLYMTGASPGFIYEQEPGLAQIDATSGAVTKLLRSESAAPGAIGTLAAAAYAQDDGRLHAYIATYTNPDSLENAPPLPPFDLHVVDTGTGALTPVTAPSLTTEQLSSASWAPGGTGLVYLDQTELLPVPGNMLLPTGQLFWAGVGENGGRPLGVVGSAPRWLRETYSPYLAPIVVPAAVSSQQQAPAQVDVSDRIVDNRDPTVEKIGDWYTGSGGQDYGSDCLWTPPNGGFLNVRPGLPLAGYYTLSTWSCGNPNDDQVGYPVSVISSEAKLLSEAPVYSGLVDPSQTPGQWQEIGVYYLEPDALVQVYSSSRGNAIFDAMRFSYQPGQSGAQPVQPAPTPTLRWSNNPPSPTEQIIQQEVIGHDFRLRMNRFNSEPPAQIESMTFDDCGVFPRPGCSGQRSGYRVRVAFQGKELLYNIVISPDDHVELLNLEPAPFLREQQWLYLEGYYDQTRAMRMYRYVGSDSSWHTATQIDLTDPLGRGGSPGTPVDGALLERLVDQYGVISLTTPDGLTLRLYGRGKQMSLSEADLAVLLQMLSSGLVPTG